MAVDQVCTSVIIIGILVLIMMGYNEIQLMKYEKSSPNTCGKKSLVSGKKADVFQEDDQEHHGEEVLSSGGGGQDVIGGQVFKKINPDEVRAKVNIRPASKEMTESEAPMYSRQLGVMDPVLKLHSMHCGGGSGKRVQFSPHETPFLGNDAYYSARGN